MKVILEMLSYPFLVRALVVGVLVSLCASLLGVSLVLKRYSMIGDGLSHVGFGALAIATALNLAPLAVAVPVVVVAAFLLLRLSQNGKLKGDAAKVDLFKEISVPVEDGSVEGQMFKRSDFGLRFGVGVTVMKHYYAGVGYDLGLLNISKDSGEGKIKNGSFFISLGYNF